MNTVKSGFGDSAKRDGSKVDRGHGTGPGQYGVGSFCLWPLFRSGKRNAVAAAVLMMMEEEEEEEEKEEEEEGEKEKEEEGKEEKKTWR
ncbi:hypothetical protein PoB_003753700 [Plakobranchus ocellatus]|uniref:Uncharacterized protein n=1 Tax=Plakobranchus ocellatus TaxID=259542 RepID=A0AAV4AUN7_9GAST|nr:hypothetical protein PoB_003753700 [Plakobranchus ocellatus]